MPQDQPAFPAPASRGQIRYATLPYLLGLAFPLSVIAANPLEIPSFRSIAPTMGLILGATLALDLLFRVLLRKSPLRELCLCTAMVFLGAYGHFGWLMKAWVTEHRLLMPLWLACFCTVNGLLWRMRNSPRLTQVTSALYLFLVCLMGVQVGMTAWARWNTTADRSTEVTEVPTGGQTTSQIKKATHPDIYYIVLDAYGRGDVLRDLYQFDNSKFLGALRERGFLIAEKARSNYPLTKWAIASTFNLDYLEPLGLNALSSSTTLNRWVNHSALTRLLRLHGYKTAAFVTGFGPTECTRFDRYITSTFALDEFQEALVGTTVFAPMSFLFSRSAWQSSLPWVLRARRGRVLHQFERIPTVANEFSDPTFVFAHIMVPHQPFLFDANGDEPAGPEQFSQGHLWVLPDDSNRAHYIAQYREQLEYTNTRVLELIDRVRAESIRPVAIVLQGDHGPASELIRMGQGDTPYWERHSIFYAASLPHLGETENVSSELYPSITSVNGLRLVLRHCLGTDLVPLEDRCYFPVGPNSAEFIDVTEAVERRSLQTD